MPISGFIPPLKFQLANGTVTGFLANKAINFKTKPATPGSTPPRGNYIISPPMNDPIYGPVAIMTPVNSSSPGSTMVKTIGWEKPAAIHFDMGPASQKVFGPGFRKEGLGSSGNPAAQKDVYAPAAQIGWGNPAAIQFDMGPAFAKQGPLKPNVVFVLTSRPISGQKSLVVTSGFADLLDALQTAGGTTVTVG